MTYRVELSKRAEDALASLPRGLGLQVAIALTSMESDPFARSRSSAPPAEYPGRLIREVRTVLDGNVHVMKIVFVVRERLVQISAIGHIDYGPLDDWHGDPS